MCLDKIVEPPTDSNADLSLGAIAGVGVAAVLLICLVVAIIAPARSRSPQYRRGGLRLWFTVNTN